MTKKEKNIRILLSAVFLLLTLWIVFPVLRNISHQGMFVAGITGVAFIAAAVPRFYRMIFKKSKVVSFVAKLLIICFALSFVGLFSLILSGGVRSAKPGCTIVVLGCRVNGETPSLMLKKRLNAAIVYANENPDSVIIVSGGQGKGEDITEAECMRRYLVENGIDEQRIIKEDRSVNTDENLKYTAEIIEREGLDPEIVIVTSRFHQYRASLCAKKYGLSSSPVSSNTDAWLAPGYWVREMMALVNHWLFVS